MQLVWSIDAVPRMEGGIQVWSLGADCFSPHRIDWLEEGVPPRRDRQFPTGFDHAPQVAHQRFHVRNKEQAKDTDDRLKVLIRKAQIGHIRQANRDVLEVALCSFCPRSFKQLLGEVHPQNGAIWANRLGGW